MPERSRDRLDDRALLALVRSGDDPDAFAAFYDRHERPLLAFLRRATGAAEVAADVAAESFAVLLARTLDPAADEIEHPQAYLYGTARHKVAEGIRRGAVEARAREALGLQPVELTDAALARIDELGGDGAPALAALAELPPEQADAVRARVLGDLTYEEIAQRLGCSDAVVRQRVSRGLRRLRARLGDRPEVSR